METINIASFHQFSSVGKIFTNLKAILIEILNLPYSKILQIHEIFSFLCYINILNKFIVDIM